MQEILDAILNGRLRRRARPNSLCPRRSVPPPSTRTTSSCSPGCSRRRRTRRSRIHIDDVPLPELAPDEARRGGDGQRHQLQHRLDLDLRAAAHLPLPRPPRAGRACGASATTCRTTSSGATPRASSCGWAPPCATGSPATGSPIHCNYVDDQDPSAHDDSMLAANQRIWGFESNFGGLADLTVVKANQLMPKPAHLTWEEAACNALTQLHQLPDAGQPQRRRRCSRARSSSSGGPAAASAATPASTSSTAAASRWRSSPRRRRSSCCTTSASST